MGDSFGKPEKILLQVDVLVNNIGVLIVYMIIIDITNHLLVFLRVICLVVSRVQELLIRQTLRPFFKRHK